MFRIIVRSIRRIFSILFLVLIGKRKAPAKMVYCDTCHLRSDMRTANVVCGGICICQSCTQKILTIHVSTNPIKSLCPHCYTSNTSAGPCDYCDIPDPLTLSETEE